MFIHSFWALLAAASFSLMAACVKQCNNYFGPLELVFYRSIFTTLTIFALVWLKGYSVKTTQVRGHLVRDVLGLCSVCIWFFTLGKLPLGTNITLTYTTSLFLAVNFIGLALIRKQPTPWGAVFAIILGFSGIVILLRPSFDSGQLTAALLCLSVALIDLFTYWQVKALGKAEEPSWRIVFYFAIFCSVGSLIATFALEGGFHFPDLYSAGWVLLMGLFATLGMLASTRAWAYGNMLLVSCLGFSAIPFSEVISIVFFKHHPDFFTWMGMLLVLIAGLLCTFFTKSLEYGLSKDKKAELTKTQSPLLEDD